MRKYNFIVWDWNGTLVDDAWLCLEIINKLLHSHNKKQITHETYEKTFTFPIESYYQKIGFNFSETPFKQLGDEWVDEYKYNWQQCRLQNGAAQIVKDLRAANMNQAIVSAMDVELLHQCVQYYDILGNFLALRGLDHHYADGKEQVAQKFVKSFDLDPQNILFIGDTVHDAQVADHIGADCVLFYSGHQAVQVLEECEKPIISSFLELYDIIGI